MPLARRLKFWFQHFIKGEDRFEESLHPLAEVATVEQFWHYYQHFKRPSQMPIGSYLYLFRHDVRPVWEDDHNKHGGAFVLRFTRDKCDRLWEDILLGFISAQESILEGVNGVRIKVKKDYAEMDFWVSSVDDEKRLESYREWITKVTGLDNDTPLEVIQFHIDE